jgi:hypothetical protein
VSEFAAALLGAIVGGAMTLLAQQLAIRHDREKETIKRSQGQAATAWSIYFKTSEVFEVLTHLSRDIAQARKVASQTRRELWQIFQCAPHDPPIVAWNTEELVFLIEQRQFDLMERYREATAWLSNMAQSMRTYREMRLSFLMETPSNVTGTTGAVIVDDKNRGELMPRIAHLRSLSESMAEVVAIQQPKVRKLLEDYGRAMKTMIGRSPDLVFDDAEPAKPAATVLDK